MTGRMIISFVSMNSKIPFRSKRINWASVNGSMIARRRRVIVQIAILAVREDNQLITRGLTALLDNIQTGQTVIEKFSRQMID